MSAPVKWADLPKREVEELVADRVMGWRPNLDPPFWPTTDIGAAWDVVEKMQGDGWSFTLETNGTGEWWGAVFWMGDTFHDADGDTAPEAICIAALRAVGVEVET